MEECRTAFLMLRGSRADSAPLVVVVVVEAVVIVVVNVEVTRSPPVRRI